MIKAVLFCLLSSLVQFQTGSGGPEIYRATTKAPVYEAADVGSRRVATLAAGHAITIISFNEAWVEIHAQAGMNSVFGFVEAQYTNFGGQ